MVTFGSRFGVFVYHPPLFFEFRYKLLCIVINNCIFVYYRYSYHHKLVPLLLTCLGDELSEIRNRSHELWKQVMHITSLKMVLFFLYIFGSLFILFFSRLVQSTNLKMKMSSRIE